MYVTTHDYPCSCKHDAGLNFFLFICTQNCCHVTTTATNQVMLKGAATTTTCHQYVVTVFYIYFCLTEHLYTLRPCCYTSPPLLACKCDVGLILFVLFAHGTAAMSATNRTMTKGHHYQYRTPLPMGQTKRTTP